MASEYRQIIEVAGKIGKINALTNTLHDLLLAYHGKVSFEAVASSDHFMSKLAKQKEQRANDMAKLAFMGFATTDAVSNMVIRAVAHNEQMEYERFSERIKKNEHRPKRLAQYALVLIDRCFDYAWDVEYVTMRNEWAVTDAKRKFSQEYIATQIELNDLRDEYVLIVEGYNELEIGQD
jgi:hypothetical protein